jgi:hypothetical protein
MSKAERVEVSDVRWSNVVLSENGFVQMGDRNHLGHGDSSTWWTCDREDT